MNNEFQLTMDDIIQIFRVCTPIPVETEYWLGRTAEYDNICLRFADAFERKYKNFDRKLFLKRCNFNEH